MESIEIYWHWDQLGPLGSMRILWNPLISIGIQWYPLEFIGIHWDKFGSIGFLLDPLVSIWIHWDPLGFIGIIGIHWDLLGFIGTHRDQRDPSGYLWSSWSPWWYWTSWTSCSSWLSLDYSWSLLGGQEVIGFLRVNKGKLVDILGGWGWRRGNSSYQCWWCREILQI